MLTGPENSPYFTLFGDPVSTGTLVFFIKYSNSTGLPDPAADFFGLAKDLFQEEPTMTLTIAL